MKIALVGNPNSGKTTLFNELTGANQHVGNWPGVTVEKKEGKIKRHKDVTLVDLPGIYSLSPYSLEEVITRDYIADEQPDAIINIVDASNLERNLYLSTQVMEMGIPVVIALNMMDIVEKNGDILEVEKLSKKLGVPVIPISAAKGRGVMDLTELTLKIASGHNYKSTGEIFDVNTESAIKKVSEVIGNHSFLTRYYAIKVLEKDDIIIERLNLTSMEKNDEIISELEYACGDDSEAFVITQRYDYIEDVLRDTYRKKAGKVETTSDKIDKIVTNKYLGLPIFFAILFAIYYIAISTVGDMTIGWVESAFEALGTNTTALLQGLGAGEITISIVVDGVISSIGAIFTFVPQLMILFFFLSLLEDSGYMSRIAFIMDRIFRRLGLSGKSLIPLLVGTGCTVPGVMATRTIENRKDREMTIILTPFVPCGAKLPVFGMMIAMMFPGNPWVGPSIYVIAFVSIIIIGILLKRTKRFKGDPAPFIMELPPYKLPRLKQTGMHMWDKGRDFIERAGTVIFAAVLVIWFLQNFDFGFNYLGGEHIEQSILATIGNSIKWIFVPLGFGDSWAPAVATITGLVAKELVVATFAAVGTTTPIMFTQVSAFAFMVFIVFASPCVAAISAMYKEFGSAKMTLKTIAFQTGLAYVLAAIVNNVGNIIFAGTDAVKQVVLDPNVMEEASTAVDISGGGSIVLVMFGAILLAGLLYVIVGKLRKKKTPSKIIQN